MSRTDTLNEAERLMTVCNSCRYCEGLCAVFPAMEMRRAFTDGDLDYLANLCHNCGACYVDCQFSPPHEFDVNVPKTLAKLRAESYRRHAWPGAFRPFFDRNGLAVAFAAAIGVAAFLLGFVAWNDPRAVISATGSFYALMPHAAMAWLFSLAALYVIVAIGASVYHFWRKVGANRAGVVTSGSLGQAASDAATLHYLDGGGVGCYNKDERPLDRRRTFHHLTFYGFLLCFAATCVATIYHYVFGLSAPYAWYQLPKILGVPGGLAIVVGTAGLLRAKGSRDPAMTDGDSRGMDTAFLVMLLLVASSGLLLMVLRGTPVMGVLLACHLGLVFAFFLTMPHGKFVHGIYRVAALIIYAHERRTGVAIGSKG